MKKNKKVITISISKEILDIIDSTIINRSYFIEYLLLEHYNKIQNDNNNKNKLL